MTNRLKEKIEAAKEAIQARCDLYLPMAQEADEALELLRKIVAPFKVEMIEKKRNIYFSYKESIARLGSYLLWDKEWEILLVHPDVRHVCRVICFVIAVPGLWYIAGREKSYQTLVELLETKAVEIAEGMFDLERRGME